METSRCFKCKENIEGKDTFSLMILENQHIKEKHLEIFKINEKVNNEFRRLQKIANDYLYKNEVKLFKSHKSEPPYLD